MKWPNLHEVLAPVPWAVVGAVATRHYMPERMTQDLDLAITVADSQEARRRLQQAGFAYQSELSMGGSSWAAPDGTPVDIIEGVDEWWAEAIDAAQRNPDAAGLPILPLPYLTLMKFRSGRVQDLADVTRMLGQADETTLITVRELFARYALDDLQDLESLVTLGKLEAEE